jgi:hypothetical protein
LLVFDRCKNFAAWDRLSSTVTASIHLEQARCRAMNLKSTRSRADIATY